MSNEKDRLYSLIPLDDFKALLGFDDREDKTSRFCLVTATFAIEQYCKRRFILKKYHEQFENPVDLQLTLKEYPVREVLAVYAREKNIGKPIEPDFYELIPDENTIDDFPYFVKLSRAFRRMRHLTGFKVVYKAGYEVGTAGDVGCVPADLASACLELAAWKMGRYKGRMIGTSGVVRGNGRGGEHFELSMPENVRSLLEPYKRRVI